MAQLNGTANETCWLANWRLFFLMCGGVWGLHSGREFLVSYYLLEKQKR